MVSYKVLENIIMLTSIMSKLYTIPHASHSSGFHFKPHIGKRFLQYDVSFDKSSIYQFIDGDQYDINKLFGLSYGMHHTNSVRFGWRSFGVYSSKIEILAYCYVDGERVKEEQDNLFIAMVDLNKDYTYRINVGESSYLLTVFEDGNHIGSKNIMHRNLPFWGYQLYPYFGGNKKAPHDIGIQFTEHLTLQ